MKKQALSSTLPDKSYRSEVTFEEFSDMLIKIADHPLYKNGTLKYLPKSNS